MSSYVPVAVAVPAEVAAGAEVDVSPRSTIAIGLSGTFVGTVQFQWSPEKTGAVWKSLGSPLTAPGFYTLPAGRARRIRANTTAYTSGTPVGTALHDTALHATKIERTFAQADLEVKASVAAGDPVDIEGGEQALVSLSGTFTATVQLQVSLSAADDDWFAWGVPMTAAGLVVIPRGIARRIRANTTAFTSGAPVAVLNRGFSAEDVLDDTEETIAASGSLSLFTKLSLLDVSGTKAYTLGDPLFLAQLKYIGCVGAASTPVGVVTPDNLVDGSTLTFDATTETAILMGVTGGWKIVALTGATLA